MCGKNSVDGGLTSVSPGSPPRVREKQDFTDYESIEDGITPACAGKTCCCLRPVFCNWDHPRVCGKNLTAVIADKTKAGSPPRVREKLNAYPPTAACSRITPACAGKTRNSFEEKEESEDHPRVCGKNTRTNQSRGSVPGSPPRVREKQIRLLTF